MHEVLLKLYADLGLCVFSTNYSVTTKITFSVDLHYGLRNVLDKVGLMGANTRRPINVFISSISCIERTQNTHRSFVPLGSKTCDCSTPFLLNAKDVTFHLSGSDV
jgi:hypothetical protein